jgi:hypothetical protein
MDTIEKFYIYEKLINGNEPNDKHAAIPNKYSKHYKRRSSFD